MGPFRILLSIWLFAPLVLAGQTQFYKVGIIEDPFNITLPEIFEVNGEIIISNYNYNLNKGTLYFYDKANHELSGKGLETNCYPLIKNYTPVNPSSSKCTELLSGYTGRNWPDKLEPYPHIVSADFSARTFCGETSLAEIDSALFYQKNLIGRFSYGNENIYLCENMLGDSLPYFCLIHQNTTTGNIEGIDSLNRDQGFDRHFLNRYEIGGKMIYCWGQAANNFASSTFYYPADHKFVHHKFERIEPQASYVGGVFKSKPGYTPVSQFGTFQMGDNLVTAYGMQQDSITFPTFSSDYCTYVGLRFCDADGNEILDKKIKVPFTKDHLHLPSQTFKLYSDTSFAILSLKPDGGTALEFRRASVTGAFLDSMSIRYPEEKLILPFSLELGPIWYFTANEVPYGGTDGFILETDFYSRPVGIQQNKKPEATIFPNPAADKLYIEGLENRSISAITIYNTLSAIVMEQPGVQEIDISTLKSGMYFLRLTTSEGICTKQFIKQ